VIVNLQSKLEKLESEINELKKELEQQEIIDETFRWNIKDDASRAPGWELWRRAESRYLGYFGSTKYGSMEQAKEAMLYTVACIKRALKA
jgi:hypothetical protein